MHRLTTTLLLCALLGAFTLSPAEARPAGEGKSEDSSSKAEALVWSAWGGELEVAWNRDLLGDLGLKLSAARDLLAEPEGGVERFAIRETAGLQFRVRDGNFESMHGGSLSVRGGYDLQAGGVTIPLRDFSLRPRAGSRTQLDVVSGDGKAWFYIDRLMYALERDAPVFAVHSMDLRVTPEFAELIGRPYAVDLILAGMRMDANIFSGGLAQYPQGGSCPNSARWPGIAVPDGGGAVYEADVFMQNFSLSYTRKTDDADGPGGTDGLVVFTPSSTLKNNRNNGSQVQTVSDPLGTSEALHAADVVWRRKFMADCPPYDNDQHPYLIWNTYRIDALGRIEQIGRSGVKHAFLTVNVACDSHPGTGFILGRGCEDTYGTSNNDSNNDLGPRSEIIAATGEWGRCGSIYDVNCDGVSNTSGNTTFDQRMLVQESAIDPALNPGASYLFESWYVVRDDINIYNTMQTRPGSFSWTGSIWSVNNGLPLRLGPAIDRWVDPDGSDPTRHSVELNLPGGHGKVAVRTTDLGGGQYRYDYAVMNLDFAVPVTEQTDNGLRVLANDGFVGFSVPIASGVQASNIEFADGDALSGNDWSIEQQAGAVVWTAPPGAALNWGTMFRFSLIATAEPTLGQVQLVTADPGHSAATVALQSLLPAGEPVELFAVGGEVSGLAPQSTLGLSLNGTQDLQLLQNGGFAFSQGLPDTTEYLVTITQQPGGQQCSLGNESGTVAGADVLDVTATCQFLSDALVANGDQYMLDGNQPLNVPAPGILENDSVLVEQAQLSLLSGPGNGVLLDGPNQDGSFTYQPQADYCGPDAFTYQVSGAGLTTSATVGLDIVCAEADVIFESGFEGTGNAPRSGASD